MDRTARMKRTPTKADWFNIAFAIWIIISPVVLGFGRDGAAMWNNLAVGVAVLTLNVVSLSGWGAEVVSGFVVPLAAWLFASPFALNFSRAAFLCNNLIMAFVLLAGATMGEELRLIAFRQSASEKVG